MHKSKRGKVNIITGTTLELSFEVMAVVKIKKKERKTTPINFLQIH